MQLRFGKAKSGRWSACGCPHGVGESPEQGVWGAGGHGSREREAGNPGGCCGGLIRGGCNAHGGFHPGSDRITGVWVAHVGLGAHSLTPGRRL